MKDDELNNFANQFINLWQENFSKAIADQQIVDYMMQAAGNMQQFYDKSTPTTAADSPHAGHDELRWRNLNGRIDELERRLKELEKPKPGRKKSGAK